MTFPFTKMHGAGNDFIVVSGSERDWPAMAPALCDRRAGAGADGILVALPSSAADLRMRMFNPDGTEDECGNGLRCLALYAVRRGMAPGPAFTIETLGGTKAVRVDDPGGRDARVTAKMGRADLSPAAIPALFPGETGIGQEIEAGGERLKVNCLSTGTAHTVIFEMPDEARFLRLSPLLETHPHFPERTSVIWTEVLDPSRARVRIWERAAGETLACGTGACAAAVAAYVTGRSGPRLAVESLGGVLDVEVGDDLSLQLSGPAAFVYEGGWPS